ncbi:SusD/RagB family nutrient-binding outer membrane lipoprotein [Pedobacter sp. HMF7647]|uniref:SusD/RagB family nutrient-binding outer membrane lipoprotein n=1 Tax=Hufsiella arboris TaxID=2695275 RepID=A0A7K1Y642_9SPHI|nr:SusD/RagB family nutrient-binding outer membrane lipoprotein [Hufsiella arboris]MXV49881.1 SusD/RagB family nutrient-binding outer membrane lipoprotein [Hufsiella arboris]
MKKIISIIALSLTIGVAGCKKDFLDLETNPNTPSTASPQLLLSGALVTTANLFNVPTTNTGAISLTTQSYVSTTGVWMGYWTSSGNYVPSSVLNTNNFTNANYQIFTPFFLNATNYNNLANTAGSDPSADYYVSVANIMKAYVFQELVDTYNNVPYTEAFKGLEDITPAYDKGEAIYDDLLKQLDASIARIKGSSASVSAAFKTADVSFKGDMTKWIKFANTLKLRIVLRQWLALPAKQAALASAIASTSGDGYIDDTFQAIVNPGYTNDDANGLRQSPFYVAYAFNAAGAISLPGDYYKANAYVISKLKATNDPRIERLYTHPSVGAPPAGSAPGTPNDFFGNIYGSSAPKNNAGTSSIGPGLLKGFNMDAVLLSSSESLFLQAEAADKGLIAGSAQSFYERGITASFVTLGVADAVTAAAAYYAQPIVNVGWAASDDKLQAIINQKWTALNGYGNMEAYNEYRRTGFPLDVPVSTQSAQPVIPTRLFYPQSEYQQNGENATAEGTINQFSSKIFWAK